MSDSEFTPEDLDRIGKWALDRPVYTSRFSTAFDFGVTDPRPAFLKTGPLNIVGSPTVPPCVKVPK